MTEVSQQTPIVRMSETIRPLALAPLGGVATVVCWELFFRRSPEAVIIGLISAPFCYAAALVLVVPLMLVWPATRQPPYVAAAAWGVIAAWCAVGLLLASVRELLRPVVLVGFGSAGGVSGLLYAWLIRDQLLKKGTN